MQCLFAYVSFLYYGSYVTGVGGFVVNDNGEVLVVKEKYSGVNVRWKYPGGGTDPGEAIM